jgi:GNAT superfamily N-acetyltransferase
MTTPPPPITRPARRTDAPALVELVGQLGYPSTLLDVEDRLERLLARPLVHRLVVATRPEDGDRLLGVVHASRRELIESEDHVEISGLIVAEGARGSGVGKVLVSAAERWARDMGLRIMRVRSNVLRTEAHAFYQRMGFRVLKQQVAFIKEL